MSSPLLEVSDLAVSLGDTKVLLNVSFVLAQGEWMSITGKNGAGKSTLLKCLMRIVKRAGGHITLGDKSLDAYSQRALAQNVAYVPQATGRQSPFSVYDHVMLARFSHLKPFAAPRKSDREKVMQALEDTGILSLVDRPVNTLSGGERQKVYLAQAFAKGANLLLLDEPGTFLDPRCTQDMLHLLKDANRNRGITILSVTHDINSAAVISDRILALKEGTVAYLGDAPSFMQSDVLDSVFNASFKFVNHPQTGLPLILP